MSIQPSSVFLEATNAPPNVRYDTYFKHGRNWIYCGERTARTARSAALSTSYVQGRRVIGIRPAGSEVKLWVYRFKQPGELHHGG